MGGDIDWHALFVPTLSIGEVVLRGTLVYLFLFFLMRILRREAGHIGLSDLLVVVLVADAAQNAMAGGYQSITEGVILVATIALWDYFLDGLSFKVPALRRLLRPAPLLLIDNGRMVQQNMKRQLIQEAELMGLLREQGIRSVGEVKQCFLEGDGRISVIPRTARANRH